VRCLLVCAGGSGAILPMVPLAHALRGAGHQVIAGGHAENLPDFLGAGVPAVAAPQKSPKDYRDHRDGRLVPLAGDLDDRAAVLGAILAYIAVDSRRDLLDLVHRWRPDLIVGGPLAYVAPLLSAELRVPYVAVEWGHAEPMNWHQATLAELRDLGFLEVPEPAHRLVMSPEGIRPSSGVAAKWMRYLPAEPMRYVPYAPPARIEPWMHTKGDRPRVWFSGGSRVSDDYALDYLNGLIDIAARLDVEPLIATPEHVAERLGGVKARVGWLPFDVLAPTCDLAVHHGGGSTMLGFVANGVPQVIIPYMPEAAIYNQPLAEYGAAKVLPVGDTAPADLLAACREVLAEPSYRLAAGRLRAEMEAAPTPSGLVERLEGIAATALAAEA
jgi:UDP:flavonoid glycosyltransferase YjiC (YdhE family)